MDTYNIEQQRASLQVTDSAKSELPENWNIAFPQAKGFLSIGTIPDHLGGVTLDIYREPTDLTDQQLQKVFEGEIDCSSGKLIISSGLPDDICDVEFTEPGVKQIFVWTNQKETPNHIALVFPV